MDFDMEEFISDVHPEDRYVFEIDTANLTYKEELLNALELNKETFFERIKSFFKR